MIRVIELRTFLPSLFCPKLSWRLGKHILKDSSKSHGCRANNGLVASGPFSLSCPEDQEDSKGRKWVTTQSAGDLLGLPCGRFRRVRLPGRRAVGEWGAVHCPGRKEVSEREVERGNLPLQVAPSHPPETPGSGFLRNLDPLGGTFSREEVFILTVKKP